MPKIESKISENDAKEFIEQNIQDSKIKTKKRTATAGMFKLSRNTGIYFPEYPIPTSENIFGVRFFFLREMMYSNDLTA